MFLFKSHKTLNHKQTSIVGFVLAVMSVLVSVVIIYGLPLLIAVLNSFGIYHLDLFLMATALVLFFSVQGLLLFEFPHHYAKDKKSHMTGLQIMLYSWLWIVVIALIIVLISWALFQTSPVSVSEFSL